jgi:hypothetical protein
MEYNNNKTPSFLYGKDGIGLPNTSFGYLPQNDQGAQEQPASQESFLSPDVAKATAYGAQSGGLSGGLISGGTTSLLTSGASTGNVAAIGGGLILSQIEAAQQAKAQKEQEEIQQAKEIKNGRLAQLNKMSGMRFLT